MVSKVFWLFITETESNDSKKFEHKDSKFRQSIYTAGKNLAINVHDKVK